MRHIMLATVLSLAIAPRDLAAQRDRDNDRITRQQLQDAARQSQTLYQVIEALRPHFLGIARRPGGGTRPGSVPVLVYVNGRKDSGVEGLRRIDPSDVEEVRYLTPAVSAGEFGAEGANGTVIVKLRRRHAPPAGTDARLDDAHG